MTARPTLSVVIPVMNEEAGLPELRRRLSAALESIDANYEVLVVNDGSEDGTLAVLRGFNRQDPRWKVIDLARNFGHGSACTAGLDHASGEAVVFMDADLQDPPELIAQFFAKWREGFEVVYGHRWKRNEPRLRQFAVKSFYRILNFFSDTELPRDVGIFSLLDARAAAELARLPERHRYLTGLRSWVGFRQTGVSYERARREGSTPSQTYKKLVNLAGDALFYFSVIPLRVATFIGVTLALTGFALGAKILYEKLFTDKPIIGWTSVILAIILIGGVILITLGVLGEYIGRIHNEIKQRPLYIVRETMGVARRAEPR